MEHIASSSLVGHEEDSMHSRLGGTPWVWELTVILEEDVTANLHGDASDKAVLPNCPLSSLVPPLHDASLSNSVVDQLIREGS